MNLQNGYKVVYEKAANGERTFYASQSTAYPVYDASGEIVDTKLASFTDADFAGHTIYEHAGKFYVSTDSLPSYNEDGTPADSELIWEEGAFEKVFGAVSGVAESTKTQQTEPERTEGNNGDDTVVDPTAE